MTSRTAPAMTLADLNAADRDRFVGALGWIFEDSPWVAERAWEHRPFASIEALHHAMTGVVAAADRSEQRALLLAHPDLGGTPPGRSGRPDAPARMSDASVGEQAGAGLDTLTPAESTKLQQMNAAYREKFGFPFLFAVKGSTRHQVLAALERRLESDAETEFAEALRQVSRIAAFRLHEFIGP